MSNQVNISLTNGNLGRVAPPADGISGIIVSGVAISGVFALGDVLGPYKSLAEVEALGITEAYDTTNTCAAWHQISEFYKNAANFGGKGQQLYIMVVAKTVTMTQMCDVANNYAKKLLNTAAGKIRLLGITRTPDGGYSPTIEDELEADMWTAITKLKELYTAQMALNRPFDAYIEGRNWDGTEADTLDLRDAADTPDAYMVSVVLGQSKELYDYGATVAAARDMASVGAAMGSAAALPVQRNIGRVRNGAVFTTDAYLTNGAHISTLTDAQIESLVAKGYIFFRKHLNKAGIYWSGDANAVAITNDYANKHRSRPIHKVVRIANDVYIEDYLDDIQLDPETGKMSAEVVKSFQERIVEAVNTQMTTRGELSGMSAFCDPDQDVLTDNQVDVELLPVPKGMVDAVNVTVGYSAGTNA